MVAKDIKGYSAFCKARHEGKQREEDNISKLRKGADYFVFGLIKGNIDVKGFSEAEGLDGVYETLGQSLLYGGLASDEATVDGYRFEEEQVLQGDKNQIRQKEG